MGEARFDDPAREYATDEVVVEWRPELCYHEKACIRALPRVFDPERRPWIDPSAASADEVEAAVALCPSGALRSRRVGVRVEAGSATTVEVTENGPLILRGDIRIVRGGEEIAHVEKVALCRCGGSANKPFCDGSHKTNGFLG
ncbi:MAG TPA: (4Fe-4S)-binding protein [Gaiellaceae bacterium]|nr:(4Fe-4S)-binding protein [Gaiellaceae bacterium]